MTSAIFRNLISIDIKKITSMSYYSTLILNNFEIFFAILSLRDENLGNVLDNIINAIEILFSIRIPKIHILFRCILLRDDVVL